MFKTKNLFTNECLIYCLFCTILDIFFVSKKVENILNMCYSIINEKDVMIMRKLLILIISSIIALGVFLCLLFSWNSTDSLNEQIVTLSKIALQSIISGFITFLGLYITISFNERQINRKELIEKRPNLSIDFIGKASSKKNRDTIDSKNTIICTESKNVRTIDCRIKNLKECEVKRIHIKHSRIISIEIKCLDKFEVALCENPIKCKRFYIVYEDVMGNKYQQKVKYKFEKRKSTYAKTTSEPKRRLS